MRMMTKAENKRNIREYCMSRLSLALGIGFHPKCLIRLSCATLLWGLRSADVQGASINYADFSSVAGLQLNGNAAQVGNVLRLTPSAGGQAGSAFSMTQIPLQNDASFSTAFTFNMSNPGGIRDEDGVGADGIVFVVQSVANNVGAAGGGIGYQGVNKSLGVEFDTWNNGGADNDGNHVAVNLNGILSDTDLTHIATRMNNGQNWYVWVDYNGATADLQVRLSQNSLRPLSPLIDYIVPGAQGLQSVLGQSSAFVGFTAGTGSAYENQDILSWQFNGNFQPIGAPDTAPTLLLLGAVLAGLLALPRAARS